MIGLLLTFFIGILEIAMGWYVFFKKTDSIVNRNFMLLGTCIGIWSIFLGLVVGPVQFSEQVFRLQAEVMFFFGYLITTSFLLFAWMFPAEKRITRWHLSWIGLSVVVISALVFFPGRMIAEVKPEASLLDQIVFDTKSYIIYAFFFLTNILMTSWVFIKKYPGLTGLYKQQIKYFATGLIVSLGLSAILAVILPIFGTVQYVGFTPFFAIIFLSTSSYAILKYRLLDVEIVIKRTTLYLVLSAVFFIFYTLVLILPQRLVGRPGSMRSTFFMLLAAIIIAVTVQPLKDWLDKVTDKVFFQKRYDYNKLLEFVSKELNSVIKYADIFNTVCGALINEMHLKNVAIFLREKIGAEVFNRQTQAGDFENQPPEYIEEENILVDYLKKGSGIVDAEEFRHAFAHLFNVNSEKAAIQKELDETVRAALVVPLVQKKNLIGFMALGAKKSGDLFTSRDIALLETLSSQMATALENVSLYQQMIANERLTIIGTMSAGIAHEIRNPLASIKTFIQMLPDRWDRPDFRQRFTEIVPSEIERLSGITADLLTFSKPSAPSLEIVSMHHTMERIKGLLSSQLRKKQLTLEYDLTSIPSIQVDPQQIFQVFLNLFLNAVYASREKGVVRVTGEVKDQVIGYHFNPGGYLVMTVEDQGIGIKRKDLANIFQPFFTTKTEGTGLGLPTCKRIVEAHHGEIGVESEEGKGTKVTVMLPTNLTQDVIKPFSGFHES